MNEEQAVSDTPETDAFAQEPADCNPNDLHAFAKPWMEYAKKLERQRNLFRDELPKAEERERRLRFQLETASVAFDALYTMLAKAIPEDAPLQPSIAWLCGQIRPLLANNGVVKLTPPPDAPELDTAAIALGAVQRLLQHSSECKTCREWAELHRDLLLVHRSLTQG